MSLLVYSTLNVLPSPAFWNTCLRFAEVMLMAQYICLPLTVCPQLFALN